MLYIARTQLSEIFRQAWVVIYMGGKRGGGGGVANW